MSDRLLFLCRYEWNDGEVKWWANTKCEYNQMSYRPHMLRVTIDSVWRVPRGARVRVAAYDEHHRGAARDHLASVGGRRID